MAEYKSYINALRSCAKEHEYEIVPFAHIRTADLCNDTADLLEKLETRDTIIISKDATNGEVIKAMFPDAQIDYHTESDLADSHVTVFPQDCDTCQDYSYDYWNAPYKKEVEE